MRVGPALRPVASHSPMSRVWLLDLDNTLHNATPVVFPRIDRAMTAFVQERLGVSREDADALRLHYWRRYGATLLGLVRHHDVDPHEFLRDTHPFPDLERIVRRDRRLAAALRSLPGRRVVLTNAPSAYAHRVLRALGVTRFVHDVVPIESMRFAGRLQPKPSRPQLRRLAARLRVAPASCVLVEDSVQNLQAARAVGMRTVLVTGFGHGHRHASGRPRIARGRWLDAQLHSVATLPRRAKAAAGRIRLPRDVMAPKRRRRLAGLLVGDSS